MAIVQDTEVLTTSAPKRRLTMSSRETAWGLLFLSPWFIGLALFYAIPIIISFVMSFTDFNPVNAGAVKFVGLANYQWMFSESATVSSFFITLKLSVIGIPLGLFAASFMDQLTISTMNWQTFSDLSFRFTLTRSIICEALIFAVLMGLTGGILPALRAAHMNIVTSLRLG